MKYKAKKYAYAYRNGVVRFGYSVPDAAICISEGNCSEWRKAVETLCRLAHNGRDFLVPGVPEAGPDNEAAIDALVAFKQILRGRERVFEAAERKAKKRALEGVT